MKENKKQNEPEIKAQAPEISEQEQIPTPPPQNKPFPTKVVAIVASAVAVVAVSAIAIVAILGGGKKNEPHTHSFGEWSVAKEATCETNGIKERFCDCGEKQTNDIYSTGHSFGAWTVVEEATCVAEGSKKRECQCGEYEVLMINKLNTHTEVVDSAVEPSCIKTGLTEGKHCSVCNTVLVEQTEIPIVAHTYTDKYDASCNLCGFERNPDCRHDNTVTIPGKAATCTETGLTDGKKCAKCGETVVPQTAIKAKGHTKGTWITDKPATCTTEGEKHQECSVCHATVDEDEIPPLGHSGGEWIYDKQPTCTESGKRHKLCTVCNNTFGSENVSALGHKKGSAVVEGRVEATCTVAGYYYEVVYCSAIDCNYEFSKTQKTIDALRHNYSNGSCSRCSAKDPYPGAIRIYSYTDLVNMKNNLSATYVLMNDIDCQGLSFVPIGNSESNAFTGQFDGQGYTISNYVSSNADYVGIIGYNRGTVRNLNVKDFVYDVSSVSNNTVNIGGIVGYNAGVIEQCAVINGDITATMNNTCRGGLVCGYNIGNVLNCVASGDVYVTQKSASGTNWITCGGITAGNEGKIHSCFVDVTVYAYGFYRNSINTWLTEAKGEAALISAVNEKKGVISNCVVMGSVTAANNRQGDICGRNDGTITNCYRDANVVLGGSAKKFEYATSQSLSTMSSPIFYSASLGWDSSIWNFTNVNLANKVYPKLIQN